MSDKLECEKWIKIFQEMPSDETTSFRQESRDEVIQILQAGQCFQLGLPYLKSILTDEQKSTYMIVSDPLARKTLAYLASKRKPVDQCTIKELEESKAEMQKGIEKLMGKCREIKKRMKVIKNDEIIVKHNPSQRDEKLKEMKDDYYANRTKEIVRSINSEPTITHNPNNHKPLNFNNTNPPSFVEIDENVKEGIMELRDRKQMDFISCCNNDKALREIRQIHNKACSETTNLKKLKKANDRFHRDYAKRIAQIKAIHENMPLITQIPLQDKLPGRMIHPKHFSKITPTETVIMDGMFSQMVFAPEDDKERRAIQYRGSNIGYLEFISIKYGWGYHSLGSYFGVAGSTCGTIADAITLLDLAIPYEKNRRTTMKTEPDPDTDYHTIHGPKEACLSKINVCDKDEKVTRMTDLEVQQKLNEAKQMVESLEGYQREKIDKAEKAIKNNTHLLNMKICIARSAG